MAWLETGRLRQAIAGDPEFRLAARRWTAVVGFGMGSQALLFKVRDGELVDVSSGDLATADIRLTAPLPEWQEFLRPDPKPFYHGLLPALVRQGFQLSGDMEAWHAYYGALRRIVALMRQAGASNVE